MSASASPEVSARELLQLEQQARRSGSGVQPDALQGCWQLQLVWPKGQQRASAFSGWLLRGLSARLEIGVDPEGLLLSNAVNLGAVELRFRGRGRLEGKRPLLLFSFEQLQLSLGGWRIVERTLPAPAPQRMPFFALIHRDPSGWLAARGRGGGLALWRLADDAAAVANMNATAP
ncbi:hypothetical protein [Vulcanococcus sp.]|jgi:hypothetical protein|uniref:hypothetical protein n=1 Tax=Vulcanococcus sp. TaxID=2856995 RepID=UPI0037D9DD0E